MSQPINKDRPIITLTNPKSPISEAYRTLRTNIQFSAIDEDLKIIMVTSAGQGEGKSTTTINLAVAYAQAEKKVLIIDADLRKPTLHHSFHVANRQGLTNVLTGQSELSSVIVSSELDNLDLIPSGPIPPNPSEILASKRMTTVLEQLSDKYDMILIDSPPTLAVTDSQVIATRCDGVILVIDQGQVKREVALKAKANLEHVKARILGVVLNNVNRDNGDVYYYYYYGGSENS